MQTAHVKFITTFRHIACSGTFRYVQVISLTDDCANTVAQHTTSNRVESKQFTSHLRTNSPNCSMLETQATFCSPFTVSCSSYSRSLDDVHEHLPAVLAFASIALIPVNLELMPWLISDGLSRILPLPILCVGFVLGIQRPSPGSSFGTSSKALSRPDLR